MTPIDYAALAERLKEHAALHDSLAAHSDEQRQWADDLRTLEAMVRGMAQAKPIAWLVTGGRLYEDAACTSYAIAEKRQRNRDDGAQVVPLFTYPTPQPQPQYAHADGCWAWGPRHYYCALREIDRLTHPAPQPEPIDPHMIVAEDRYPDEPEPTEAQTEQERSEQAKADAVTGYSMLQWIKLTDRMPNPHGRVLIFTEGYDFNGEQVFDVKAETLNECFYADPDDQPEVCRVASHWMPHPTAVLKGESEPTEAQIERLRAEVEALRAAIERHRLNIWGDHEVQHPEDVALYAALAAKE